VASSGSDLRSLGTRLAAVLTWCQAAVVLLVATGVALDLAGGPALPLKQVGLAILVASPFVVTAAVAATAARERGRLIAFAVATLVLAGMGIALAA
jgi:heme/copper-type cytochrome/quinol oxidase subunit 3